MKWRIYYGDGTTCDSANTPPALVRKRDVQIILVQCEEVGRRVERETDYYVWTEAGWMGVDKFGLFDYLIDPGYKIVLFGRMLSTAEYKKVLERALLDPDFPRKSGRLKTERVV